MSISGSHCVIAGLLATIVLLLIACSGGRPVVEDTPPATPAPESPSESGNVLGTPVPDPSPKDDTGSGDVETPSPPGVDSGVASPAPPTQPSPMATEGAPQAPMLGSAGAYVEGVGEMQPLMPPPMHVDLNEDPNDDFVTYNSIPPTSGDHWSTPVRCGFYIQPVPDEMVVHNMEHSNIVVSYNLTSQDDFDALVDVYEDLPELWREHFTVVRPYGKIGDGQVAVSTWGVLDKMDGVDGERIVRFFEHYVGNLGPEGAISCRGSQESMPGG